MKRINRQQLPRGGFAGLKETRLIRDIRIGGTQENWDGLANFVYLADAKFLPFGETRMHDHHEIDVITIMLKGRLHHQGSLKDGQSMQAGQVQVQRAGGEGFSHNEINPDNNENRLLQLWVLPEQAGAAAAYKLYQLEKTHMQCIYGGNSKEQTFASGTQIDVGLLTKGQQITHDGDCLAYVASGQGYLNGELVKEGDLISASNINLTVSSDELHLTVVSHTN